MVPFHSDFGAGSSARAVAPSSAEGEGEAQDSAERARRVRGTGHRAGSAARKFERMASVARLAAGAVTMR